jgi:hypothetical protein
MLPDDEGRAQSPPNDEVVRTTKQLTHTSHQPSDRHICHRNAGPPHIGCYTTGRAVSWWSVVEHVAPLLEQVRSWPMAGTPAWCALDDDDPRKLAALFDAARHWALHLETNQQARAEASHDISAAGDWRSIADETRRRREVYIPREVAS